MGAEVTDATAHEESAEMGGAPLLRPLMYSGPQEEARAVYSGLAGGSCATHACIEADAEAEDFNVHPGALRRPRPPPLRTVLKGVLNRHRAQPHPRARMDSRDLGRRASLGKRRSFWHDLKASVQIRGRALASINRIWRSNAFYLALWGGGPLAWPAFRA